MPSLLAQFRRPALDVWAGLDSFTIGFVGGNIRETVAMFATFEDAGRAYRAAKLAADRLDTICRGETC